MAIKHHKVSAIADGADATQVRPSDWNTAHDVDNGSLAAALSTFAATQRVIGRNTAGAGNGEEVTASQLLDWIANANGAILGRFGGSWGALANVSNDNGDLVAAAVATPPAAPASGVKLYGDTRLGRAVVAMRSPVGEATPLQASFARNRVGLWVQDGVSVVTTIGLRAPTASGTATARTYASTSMATSIKRVGYVSAAGAGSLAGLMAPAATGKYFWRGNASKLGGFSFATRWIVSDAALVATSNMFVGMTVNAYTDVAPSTTTNLIGVGCDSGDTTLQLYAAGAAAQTRASLGANFPVNTVSADVYELTMFADPNGSTVSWRVERLNTGDVASGIISAAANLPSSTTFLLPTVMRSNGGTATAVGIDFVGLYTETDF